MSDAELIAELRTRAHAQRDALNISLAELLNRAADTIAAHELGGADDARAEAERRVQEGDGLHYDMEVDAFVMGAGWRANPAATISRESLVELIANTYANEFYDPAGKAADAILAAHKVQP